MHRIYNEPAPGILTPQERVHLIGTVKRSCSINFLGNFFKTSCTQLLALCKNNSYNLTMNYVNDVDNPDEEIIWVV